MVQPPINVPDLLTSANHHVGALPIIGFPAQPPSRSARGSRVGVKAHVIRQVVVLDIAGRLSDVVEDLDHRIELALADTPRGVVCDLSAVLEGGEAGALDVVANVGRHVRDWPGIPVAVACPDPLVRTALTAHRLGVHLIVTASLSSAVSAVLATPAPAVQWLHLAPHPTAMRASRDFVTRTLLDWRLGRAIRFARLVVSELVMNSTMKAGTDVDVSIAWNLGGLRLTVRDYSPGFPHQRYSALGLHDRGLAVVTYLSRSFGSLPTTDGGTFVWAVLDATRPRPSTNRPHLSALASRQAPKFADSLGFGGMPFCAETGPYRSGHRAPGPPNDTPAPDTRVNRLAPFSPFFGGAGPPADNPTPSLKAKPATTTKESPCRPQIHTGSPTPALLGNQPNL